MLRKIILAVVVLALGAVAFPAQAVDYAINTFDFPGTQYTYATKSNDNGLVVGYYGLTPQWGFVKDGDNYTTITYPDSSSTYATGINNNGYVVGYYYPKDDNTRAFPFIYYGGGSYETLSYPSGAQWSQASDITNNSPPAGYPGSYKDDQGAWYAFTNPLYQNYPKILDQSGYTFNGGNDNENYVGDHGDYGFLASYDHISEKLVVVNEFKFNGKNTSFTDINNGMIIVGYYLDDNYMPHGLIYDYINDTFTFLDAGGVGTILNGINDNGEITGYYRESMDSYIYHGFVATPVPLPSALSLLGVGLFGLAAYRRFRG